ncbi:MAG: 50S ribosomal protein L25, partial [Planctomycetota bacterium]
MGAAKRLRTDDHIPGVVYGQGWAPVAVSVARRDLRIALSGPSGLNAVIQLKVGDTVCPTVVKEMQRDP